ncbi:hypothetical protein [Corynebacterium flavescens]|uniref:hypothetical protein n=1 Tax=Corynebacterium flavescens TaxID=28028 RepID=UPI000EC92A10|nr:hypothetical protein [Corynebacterium flavescens]
MKKQSLYALVGALCLTLSACGNAVHTKVSGQVGFSLNEAGGIVIEVESCGAELDSVDLAGPNVDGANRRYASFVAEEPTSGYFDVDISNPGSNWREDSQIQIPETPDELLIANASSLHEDIQAYPVDAKLSEILALKPGEILIGSLDGSSEQTSRKVLTQEEFTRCD